MYKQASARDDPEGVKPSRIKRATRPPIADADKTLTEVSLVSLVVYRLANAHSYRASVRSLSSLFEADSSKALLTFGRFRFLGTACFGLRGGNWFRCSSEVRDSGEAVRNHVSRILEAFRKVPFAVLSRHCFLVVSSSFGLLVLWFRQGLKLRLKWW